MNTKNKTGIILFLLGCVYLIIASILGEILSISSVLSLTLMIFGGILFVT